MSQTEGKPANSKRLQLAAFLLRLPVDESLSLAQTALDENLVNFYLARLHEANIRLPDSPEMQALQKQARANLSLDSLQNHAVKTISRVLLDADIKAIWLKGTVFGHTIYADSSYRQREDLDLIVAIDNFEQGKTIIENLGYHALESEMLQAAERLNHHVHFVNNRLPALRVELHHQLLGQKKRHWLSAQHLACWLAEAQNFQLEGMELLCLRPEAQFLYQAAHGFLQHGAASLKLRDYLDLHLLASFHKLDYARLVDEAVELRWTYLLKEAFCRCRAYFGTEFPDGILETLDARRPNDEDVAMIMLRTEGDIRAESVFQMLKQLNSEERRDFLQSLLVPSADYMRERYQIPAEKSVFPWYLYRWFDQLKGIIYSGLQRLRHHWRT
jgi:hypothetical protein